VVALALDREDIDRQQRIGIGVAAVVEEPAEGAQPRDRGAKQIAEGHHQRQHQAADVADTQPRLGHGALAVPFEAIGLDGHRRVLLAVEDYHAAGWPARGEAVDLRAQRGGVEDEERHERIGRRLLGFLLDRAHRSKTRSKVTPIA
jgi:hypothetical protein